VVLAMGDCFRAALIDRLAAMRGPRATGT
jgi:hypothetical protein